MVLLYVCHSGLDPDTQPQNWALLDSMMLQVLEQLDGGYVETQVFDCGTADLDNVDPSISLPRLCANEPFQPTFNLFKPPEIKLNPYTGKPMPTENINFQGAEVND